MFKHLTESYATSVLLATMCIPPEESSPEDLFEYDVQKERNIRISTLLGFGGVPVTPKRQLLLDELV